MSFESRLAKLQGGRIDLKFDKEIATVTLDNVKKHNALSGQMMLDFRKCVEELEVNRSVKAVVFTGAGNKAFCAGSDLDCLTEFTDSDEGTDYSACLENQYFRWSVLQVHAGDYKQT